MQLFVYTARRTLGVVGGGVCSVLPFDTFNVVTDTGFKLASEAIRSLLSRVLELDRLNISERRPLKLPLFDR